MPAKAPKPKVHYHIPAKNLPAVTRANMMEKSIVELIGKNDDLRRLLWMAIEVAEGRIEIDGVLYERCRVTPHDATLIKAEPQMSGGKQVVVLVHCNEKGDTLDDPGPRRIIVPR